MENEKRRQLTWKQAISRKLAYVSIMTININIYNYIMCNTFLPPALIDIKYVK